MIDTLPGAGSKTALYNPTAEPTAPLGECFFDNELNNWWVYLRANVALSKGEAVAPSTVAANALSANAAAGSNKLTNTSFFGNGNLPTATVPRSGAKFRENVLVMVVTGTGAAQGQWGTILDFTDDEATVYWHGTEDGTLETAIPSTATIALVMPWLVYKAANKTNSLWGNVVAWAQTDVPVNYFFWGLMEGIGVALAGAILTINAPLTIDATDGRVAVYVASNITPIIGTAHTAAADGALTLASLKASCPIAKAPGVGRGGPYRQSYQHAPL